MNDYDLEVIGNFIAERRKMFGYTQIQLAELINASHKTVSKWETGHSFPDLCYQVELCRLLKIHLSELHAGKLNKKLRIKNALNKVLLFFFLLIIVILLPAFFYLLKYYNESYDTFKIHEFVGTTDSSPVVKGLAFEYYKYNILVIDYSLIDKTLIKNKMFDLNLYYKDSIIYHANVADIKSIIVDKKYQLDNNWSFKILLDNKTIYAGNISFGKSLSITTHINYYSNVNNNDI